MTTDPAPTATVTAQTISLLVSGLPNLKNQFGPGHIRPDSVRLSYRGQHIDARVDGRWVGENGKLTDSRLDQHYRVRDTADIDCWPDWLRSLSTAYRPAAPAAVLAEPADRAAVCICGHPQERHFEDVCHTCGCGDYLEPRDAAEVIARWRQAAVKARATVDRVRRLHDALDAETDLTSPDDEITRGAAARQIAAALDGWTDPAELRRLADEAQQDGAQP